jgi:lipoprotein-releasing system ATP-binding protein
MSNPARKICEPAPVAAPRTGSADEPRRLRLAHPVAIAAVGLHKSYRTGAEPVPVLCGVDVRVREGEFVSIAGSSGSGKSTLLHLLGTLDAPDRGEVWIGQQCVNTLRPLERDRLRNAEIGLIFQFYHLLPELTALENVMLPHMIGNGFLKYWRVRNGHRQRATELLKKVGLGHRLHHRPSQLSGGEMQRAAIARSLVTRPRLLLADEPTGNLDRRNSEEIIRTLMKLRDEENLTIIMVTHDEGIARSADRMIRLDEGRIV